MEISDNAEYKSTERFLQTVKNIATPYSKGFIYQALEHTTRDYNKGPNLPFLEIHAGLL
jgi:hypothetical protein